MKPSKPVSAFAIFLLGSVVLVAQDPLKVDTGHYKATSRPNMAIKVLADGPRAVAYRVTADPSFQEPAGSKHEYDQVVIALGPSQMSLSIDGKPATSSFPFPFPFP